MIRYVAALLLLSSPALAQDRSWSEITTSAVTGAKLTALTAFVSGLGINRVANLVRLSCVSKVDKGIRYWECGDIQRAACVDEAQYDAAGAQGRLVAPLALFGDAEKPAPAWFITTGCASGDWVAVLRTLPKRVEGADLINLSALMVEAWGIDAAKARGFSVERNLGNGTATIAVRGVKQGTRADFRAAWKSGRPQEQYLPGAAELVD